MSNYKSTTYRLPEYFLLLLNLFNGNIRYHFDGLISTDLTVSLFVGQAQHKSNKLAR